MLLSNGANQFSDGYGFAYTSTAINTSLTTLDEGGEKVNNL